MRWIARTMGVIRRSEARPAAETETQAMSRHKPSE